MITHSEPIFFDCWNDIFEEDFWGQCVAVIHNRLPVTAVPAVHLYTAAASFQSPKHKTNTKQDIYWESNSAFKTMNY